MTYSPRNWWTAGDAMAFATLMFAVTVLLLMLAGVVGP